MEYKELLKNIERAKAQAKVIGENAIIEIHADSDMLDYLVTLPEFKVNIPKHPKSITVGREFLGFKLIADNRTFVSVSVIFGD